MFKLTVRGETLAELKSNLADMLASFGGPVAVSGPSIAEVVAAANAEPEKPRTRRSRKASEPDVVEAPAEVAEEPDAAVAEMVEPTPPVEPGPTDAEVIGAEDEAPGALNVEAMLAAEVASEPAAEPADPWAAFVGDFSEAVNARVIPADAALLIAKAIGVASIASVKSDTAKLAQAREALGKLIFAASAGGKA